jgi:hypothetical protein
MAGISCAVLDRATRHGRARRRAKKVRSYPHLPDSDQARFGFHELCETIGFLRQISLAAGMSDRATCSGDEE